MLVEIKIDPACEETKLMVVTKAVTEEVSELVNRLSRLTPKHIIGFSGDTAQILEKASIQRMYAQSGKVYADVEKSTYVLRERLYELEEKLDPSRFVRISNSEIVNLEKAGSFDLSLAGVICVRLANGAVCYVSRRYVQKVKQVLGI